MKSCLSGFLGPNEETSNNQQIISVTNHEELNSKIQIVKPQGAKIVQIIAPSSSGPNKKEDLQKFKNLLADRGFEASASDEIFSEEGRTPFSASSKANRVKDLKSALTDEKTKIIWCFRGGYGASELINDIQNLEVKHPKILVGFSDITPLHTILNEHYKIPSIYGSMGTQIINKPSLMDKVLDVIKGKDVVFSLTALNDEAKKVTEISAPITGGNLTLIGNTISTKAEIAPKGKILVLEDVSEKGYAIYRELVHLKQAKILDDVKAIVFGEFTKGDDHIDTAIKIFAYPNDSTYAEQIGIKEVPCFRTEDLGGSATYPCILGCMATISWNSDCGEGDLTMKSPFEVIE